MKKLVLAIATGAAYLATLTPATAAPTPPKAKIVDDTYIIVVCVTTSGDPFGCSSACVYVC